MSGMLGAPGSEGHVSLFSLYALIPYEIGGRKRCLHHSLSHTQDQLLYVLRSAVCPLTEEIDYESSTSVCPKRDSMGLQIVWDTTQSQESVAEKSFRLGSWIKKCLQRAPSGLPVQSTEGQRAEPK